MRRIDYAVTWSERVLGFALPTVVRPALRAPLAALACAIALVIVMWGVQHARLRAAERDGAQLAYRLADAEHDLARVRVVERDGTRLRALAERLASIRRSGPQHASEIAVIGNQLPADAWLTSLRADRAAIQLEGRGTRLAAVGTAIASLSRIPAYAGARLISVHDDPNRTGVTFAVALEPHR